MVVFGNSSVTKKAILSHKIAFNKSFRFITLGFRILRNGAKINLHFPLRYFPISCVTNTRNSVAIISATLNTSTAFCALSIRKSLCGNL